MASNLTSFFRERYKVAIDKWETDRHEEALTELSDLLMDPQIPMLYRLKANMALAQSQEDWFHAEDYRTNAERVYEHIRTRLGCPEGDMRWPGQERELVALREQLDALADEQSLNRPEPQTRLPESSEMSTMDSTFSSRVDAADPVSESTSIPLPVRSQPSTPTQARFRHFESPHESTPSHKRRSPEKEDPVGSPSKKRKGGSPK